MGISWLLEQGKSKVPGGKAVGNLEIGLALRNFASLFDNVRLDFIFVWIRATLPRLRYDQLMELGWKRLIPASLVWLILSAIVLGLREFGLPWS